MSTPAGDEQASPSDEIRATLARWSGWGAVPQLFDRGEFANQRAELQQLLTDEEYAAARRSTQNAHYTDASLVSAIWDGLGRLGFTGGDVLEPGCGSGHFIGLAPDTARMTGVEREPVSAAIAAALYPQATIVPGSFAEMDANEGAFDAAVGNVPFAKVKLVDAKHNPGRAHSIHNHFILKSLRLTRPGGIVAVLTSRYTMDARNPAARAEMALMADLVGAIRLPTGAHRRAAGTEAVTDLLILRRREDDATPAVTFSSWEKALPSEIGSEGAMVEINRYFLDHPENVLGDFELDHGMYKAEDLKVRGDLDTLPRQFTEALTRITDDAVERGLTMSPRGETTTRPATTVAVIDPEAAKFQGFLTAKPDGTFTRRVGDTDQPYEPVASQAAELRALLGVRDVAMALINAEQASVDDTPQIRGLREHLNTVYDAYVAEFKPINRFTERRQLRQGWHVFGEWCDRNGHEKADARPEAILGYLTELRQKGLGQDQLKRHLKSLVTNYETAFTKAVQKAAKSLAATLVAANPDRDLETVEKALLEKVQPETVLARAAVADPRPSKASIDAAQRVIDEAPEKTDPDLDLDELGLRQTTILRPPQGGFRLDPFSNVARALERFDPTTQSARKADIFTKRVVNPPRLRLGADTPEEALSICLDTHSRIDLPEIARLLGLPGEDEARAALADLVFEDPETGEPVWKPFYLAGNVRQKLARAQLAAEDDPKYEANVAALEQVIPEDLGPEDIEVRLGSWIGPEYVQQFLRELLEDDNVLVESVAGLWLVDTDRRKLSKSSLLASGEIWAGGGMDAYEITERLLVGAPIRVYKAIEVLNDKGELVEKPVLDPEATEEATDKAAELSDRFADWVWEDTDRAQKVMRLYNDTFNAEIPVDYSGIELSLPGLSQALPPREHQKIAIARVIYQGGTGLVHEVGAGKTLEMIVGVMERKRRGLASKPVVVVPNDSIAEQFEREWLQAYPGARLLTGMSSDLANDKKKGKNGRAEFVARVATGDWDAVIMTKESFQRIPLPPEIQEKFLNAELDELRAEKENHAEVMSESMTKRIETAMDNAEERLKKRMDDIERDTAGMTFIDAGFDFVVVDEAQNYKNGLVISAIPDLVIDGSNRAIDLDMKLGHLQEKFGSARVVLATATPWTGKFSEVYLWQRRLGHNMPRFDEWARTYVTPETYMEMSPGGALRSKVRTRRVINEPELWRSLRLTSDIKMKNDLNLKVPRLRDRRIEIIEVPASAQARIFTLDLARRERQLSGPPEKGADNHLWIAHDGQLAALDLRTVGISTPEPQKVDVIAADIYAESEAAKDNVYLRGDGTEHPVRGGLILVFCDESTPSRHWNFYAELRSQLVTLGMKEDAVRFIHEAGSPQRKADMLAAAREGAISVLVGSTMKMGAGINVQDRVLGGYEITGHWRPDITAQAIGRAERQGNQNPEYFWKRVVLAPSMDAKKWEITGQKALMFAPLYSSQPPERSREIVNEEADSLADVMAAATGDPRYKEKAELDAEQKKLTRQRSSHGGTQQALKLAIAHSTKRIPTLQARAERQDEVAKKLVSTERDKFSMRVGKRSFTKRPEAATAVRDRLLSAMAAAPVSRDGTTIQLGTIGGFDVAAILRPLNRPDLSIQITFPDAAENTPGFYLNAKDFPGGIGVITRLENQLKTISAAGDQSRKEIVDERASIERARTALGKPFPGEARLAEVVQRRNELISQLSDIEEADYDPNEDPDSPEAKARKERAEARAEARMDLFTTAADTAEAVGLDRALAEWFGSWYSEITSSVIAEQRPSIEQSLDVWLSIGKPGSGGRTVLAPMGATPRPTAESAPALEHVEPDQPKPVADPATSAPSPDTSTSRSAERTPIDDVPAYLSARRGVATPPTENSEDTSVLSPADDGTGLLVLESLGVRQPDQQWDKLRAELSAFGYRHDRRDGIGSDGLKHDERLVLTDSSADPGPELRSLAAHVDILRQRANIPRATELITELLATEAAHDPDQRHEFIRLAARTGLRGAAAGWAADVLGNALAQQAISAAAATTLDAVLLAPNGDEVTTDADLEPWIDYSRGPFTYGALEIVLLRSPAGITAQITPAGGQHRSYWLRLPIRRFDEENDLLAAITAPITGATASADELRSRVVRELARTLPLPTQAAQDPTPTPSGPINSTEIGRTTESSARPTADTQPTEQAHTVPAPVLANGVAAEAEPVDTDRSPDQDTANPDHRSTTPAPAATVATEQPPLSTANEVTPTLAELRELAAAHALDVTVVRVGTDVFVTVHEPNAPAQPVLTFPSDRASVVDGAGRPLPVGTITDYLRTYRETVVAELFMIATTVRDWPRRVAQLAPHLLPGDLRLPQVQEALNDAAHLVDQGKPVEADQALRRAEAAAGPITLPPARERQIVRAITDLASGYAKTGTPGRYIAESHIGDSTWAEWSWIDGYIAAHPEVLDGHPDRKGIKERDTAERDNAAQEGLRITRDAGLAHRDGNFERALELLDAAELAHPDARNELAKMRDRVRVGIAERDGHDEQPSPPTSSTDDAVEEIVSGDASTQDPAGLPTSAGAATDPTLETPDYQIRLHAEINAATAAYFDQQLDASAGAQEYLRRRLGGQAAIDRVRARSLEDDAKLTIGYAPDRWTGLVEHLRGKGFRDQDLVDAGVAKVSSRNELIDLFRHRIVFAVRDQEGRIAGFTGRSLHSDEAREADPRNSIPKYFNTQATVLYDKSRLVFGLYEQRDLAATADPVFIEGPFDVAALMAAAPPEPPLLPLAPCGTSLTTGHLDAVDQLVPIERRRVYGPDGDGGGLRALPGQLETGIRRYQNVEATILPDGLDPAKFAEESGSERLIGAYMGAPYTRPALEVLVDLRIEPYADRLGEQFEVEASIAAAREVAQVLALVEPDRITDLALATATRIHIDPEHLAEFIAEARTVRLEEKPERPVLSSESRAPENAEPDVATEVEEAQRRDDDPAPQEDDDIQEETPAPPPDDPSPGEPTEEATAADDPATPGDGSWLLAPVARYLDEHTPLPREWRADSAGAAFDALASIVAGDALDRLTETGGHEGLDLLLQADRLEAIAQAAERAEHEPVTLIHRENNEQQVEADQIDAAFLLLAQRPGSSLALRCGDLMFRSGTDRLGPFISIEPTVWRSDDEQPWGDRVRLAPATVQAKAASDIREQVQDQIRGARSRAVMARGQLNAMFATRGIGESAQLRTRLKSLADKLGPEQTQRIGAQLARVDLLRQFATASAFPAADAAAEFTLAGEPIQDAGTVLAQVGTGPDQPHHSEVLRWRGLEVSTRWAPGQDKPLLFVAVAPVGASGSDRRTPLMFQLDPAWITGGQHERIVEFLRRTVANAERIALSELRAAGEALDAPERQEQEQAQAAAEQTTAARAHAAANNTLVIEHNGSGTVVHGSSKEDKALHNLLHNNKFKYSRRKQFWFLPRQWLYTTRQVHVRGLTRDLEKAGRGFELWDKETAATPDTVAPPPLPAAETYTTGQQLRDAERAVTQAYWSFQDTAAGRRLLNYGADRPDAEALRDAHREVSLHRLDGGLDQSVERYVALYRAATIMHDNLVAERKNAPKMMQRLALVVERAGIFAASLSALAAQDPNSSIAAAALGSTADQAEAAPPETQTEAETSQLDIFTPTNSSGPEPSHDGPADTSPEPSDENESPAADPTTAEDDGADTVPESAAEAESPGTATESRPDAEQTQSVDLPELTARQKAHLLRTHDELLTRLTVSSFTHVQAAGAGVPGVVDVAARTVTTDPNQPREQEMRCLTLLSDQVRHYRQQLADKAQAIPVADEAQARALAEMTGPARELDMLGDTVANATEENRRYIIPTKSLISQQLNDGQIETALLGFARAARDNVSLETAFKGKNILIGPNTTGMAWHDLTLEFARHGATGVVLSISTPDSRARDEIVLDQLDLDEDTAGHAIRAAFEEHIANLGARADAAREAVLDQFTPASSADEATSAETDAAETERPDPAVEAEPKADADVAVAPQVSDPDASAAEPSAVSGVSDQDSHSSMVRLADTVLGGARLSREETIAHWGAMANPHPEGSSEAQAWERGRAALISEVERSRVSRPSPAGALLAYKVPGRKSVWSVVQVATGHPVLNKAQIDIPRQSTPQSASKYTVMELPDAAVPHYLAALERALDPDGNQIDWTDHASMLRTAEPWRLAGSATRLTLGGDPATVGLREIHAAALLFAATKHPHAVGGAPAFDSALHVILPSRDAVWGGRIAGDVVDDFTTTATQFSADGPALEDTRQHRKLRNREQDQTTYAVVRLAAAHAFGGRPRDAVDLLLDRAATLTPSDEARPSRYGSNRLRHLATAVAELFSPVETELERLLATFYPGAHVMATAVTGSPGVGATWVITGPAQRRSDPQRNGRRVVIPVDRLDEAGPVHGWLHISLHEISRRIWVTYDHAQPDNDSERTWSEDLLYHVAAGQWAVIDSGSPLPTTAAELEALTRRAERAFAGEGTRRAELLAGPARDGDQQADAIPGVPTRTPAAADATVQGSSDADIQAAEDILAAARTNIRALLDGVDVGYLSTAAQELDELAATEAALEMIWRGMDVGNTALLERPAGKIASDALYGTTRGTGFEPDLRAQLAVKSGLGVPTAAALHALGTEFLARRDADDPLGRALAKTRVDEVAWDLITVAKQMGVHGGFTMPAAVASAGPVTAPESGTPQTAVAPDEPEPDFDVEYDEAGFNFVDGMHGISQLFVDNHWVLQETELVEIGGMWSEHWARHDVSVTVSLTPDDRVLSTVFRRHGPFESPDWEELEFTSAQSLRDLVEQAGLHGVARPAQLPGLWRVENADFTENAHAAAGADDTLRLVTRQADTRDPAWSFADDGKPVSLAPPLPTVPVTDRKSLLAYVLGDRVNEDKIRNLVSIALSARVRKGIYPSDALRQLLHRDIEIYRRAVTANAGRRYRGDTFDYARAQEALVRLAEGDPALPLNALGQYIELQEGTWGPDADRLTPVRGILRGIGDLRGATGQLTVTIDRDVPAADGTLHKSEVVDVDATLTVLNLASRPTAKTREAANTATRPVTEAEEQRLEQDAPAATTVDTAESESPAESPESSDDERGSTLDAAPEENVPVLRLADGRELTHRVDPGPDELPRHFTIAEEAYIRTEPGRFRLIVGRNYADTGDIHPWWWTLQRIDQDGVVSGAGIEAVDPRHDTADDALAAAQRHLASLEEVLDSPSPFPSEKTSVSGPMASITFIPAWGDVCAQLQDIDVPAAVEEQQSAQLAVTVAQRLIKSPSPEEDARWLLDATNAPYAADATRQLRDLVTIIRASGLPDLIPGTEWRLSDALDAVRDAVLPQLEPPATTAPEPELGEITLPPEPIDEDTEILPPDLAELGVEQIFLELDRWRHPRTGVAAAGVPESVAAVHNRMIDLLTPDTIAIFGDRRRAQVATEVRDSYRFNLLAEAVREAQEASEPLRPDFRTSPAQDVSALDREAWKATFEALVDERDPESSVRWGRIRITVELDGAAIAQIAIADPDTGEFEVTHRLPFHTENSLVHTHDPIGDTLWVAAYGAKARAILARYWIHEGLHDNGLSPLAQAQARCRALPSTKVPDKHELFFEVQKIESHVELVWTWALAQLNELELGRPPGDEDAFSFSFLEFDAADPGKVLAPAAVRDTVGQESEHLWWRGLRVYTEHTKEGELELVFCETNGQGGWLLAVPLTREQFTPEGVTAALYGAVANAEQDVIDRTNTALATIAAYEAPAQPATDREVTAPAAVDTAVPETPAEPDPEPGNESEPGFSHPDIELSSHADAAPSGQQASSSSAVQPGLFDLATPGTPAQSADPAAPATTEGRSAGELSRAPLTAEDIALALRRKRGEHLAGLLRAMSTPGAAQYRPSIQGYQIQRSADEPDPGARERVDINARAMEISVKTGAELRTGRLSWKALNEWLRAGLDGADLRMLTDASAAHDQLAAYLNQGESTKDAELLRSGLDEVAGVRDRAAASILDRALRNHQADTAPAPWRGRGRDPLLRPASDGQLTETQQATLAMINDLTAAIPDGSASAPAIPDGAPARGEPSTAATSTAPQSPKPAESSPGGQMGSDAPVEEAAHETPRPETSTAAPSVPAAPLDALTFDPSGPGAAEQLTSMQMPDPVKLHEPSRLAFVAATRIVQQPATALAMHVTWLANVASSTTEAAEAAQQLLRLADRITRSALSDQIPGSDLQLITALEQAREQLLTRLGLPTTRPPDAPPGPDAAADPGTGSEESAAEDATVSTTDVLSDLQLSWEQLEEMAQEAKYTVVLQRHATEPATDHALRTITIPLVFDKDRERDQLTSEVIALLRNPPPASADADTTSAAKFYPSPTEPAAEEPPEGEPGQPAQVADVPSSALPSESVENAPTATPVEASAESTEPANPATPAAEPRTAETHRPATAPDVPVDTASTDMAPLDADTPDAETPDAETPEAETPDGEDTDPAIAPPASGDLGSAGDSFPDEDLADYEEYLADAGEEGRADEERPAQLESERAEEAAGTAVEEATSVIEAPAPAPPVESDSDSLVYPDAASSDNDDPAQQAQSDSADTQEPPYVEALGPREPHRTSSRSDRDRGAGHPPQTPERERPAPDPIATQWSDLVAQASTFGFEVRNSYTGVTTVDWSDKVIQIAVTQPVERVVALALKIGEISGKASVAATAPREERQEQHNNASQSSTSQPAAPEAPRAPDDGLEPQVSEHQVVRSVPASADSIPISPGHPLFDQLLTEFKWDAAPLVVPDTWPSGPVPREPAFAERQQSYQDSPAREAEERRSPVAVRQREASPDTTPIPSDHPMLDQLLAEIGWDKNDIPGLFVEPAPAPLPAAEHVPAPVSTEPAQTDPAPLPPPPPRPETAAKPEQRLQQRPVRTGLGTGAFGTRAPAARGLGGAVGRAFGALGFGRRNGRR